MKYHKKNWVTGKYLDQTWTKERYLEFKKAYNHAVDYEEDVFLFERKPILTRFAYFLLQHLKARFEH